MELKFLMMEINLLKLPKALINYQLKYQIQNIKINLNYLI